MIRYLFIILVAFSCNSTESRRDFKNNDDKITDSTVSEDRRPEIKDHKPAPTFSLVDISKFPYKQLDSTYFDWE
ncbi:hypothetical protein, partial [Fulvivirga kasyanovii]|uniref:hypothetical protein n=1 Tax=Fulvivirga kasyanovii TaxID=396812 RepID=UPI0031E1287A